MNKSKICVLGLGYIGLPTASLLATKGFQVHGVDTNENIVKTINQGAVHIVEPDLDILVRSATQSGFLIADKKPTKSDIFIIAVPTPISEDRSPNLDCVEASARQIAPYLEPGNIVILESTCPLGTTEKVSNWIQKFRGNDDDIYIAHCPERVLPGKILRELVENDRIIGGLTIEATKKVSEFYKTFINGKILETDAKTAEMAKLVENSFRDVNIAFANELSMIAEEEGINVWELIKIANRHPRVNILEPGPGVGGHCIAIDPWFLVHSNPGNSKLIRTSRNVNEEKPRWIVRKIEKKAKKFKNPTIACLGLAYKNDIDDLRESPSLKIAKTLESQGVGKIVACEPNLNTTECEGVPLFSLDKILEISDIVIILVNHKEFLNIDRSKLQEKVVIDVKGILL